ncbi:hypothetical protein Ddye_030570 [Dipteronia dyeriana]|uniref:Xylanase inhibitor N-terminal domain-containing protein n=1 Tax=Dipteronia dyeriana TaxID=168575 RepID=A0AAD9WMU6_9ROSI|nr:hypothetical protein Ddye_030570 [Dipteronia dyeriana]
MLETLILGQKRILNMAMGCGRNNQVNTLSIVTWLLGLGGGQISFLNQLSVKIGGSLSYCLGSRSPGWLAFGIGLHIAFPMGVTWAVGHRCSINLEPQVFTMLGF